MFEKNNENKNRVDNKKQQIRGKKEEKKLKKYLKLLQNINNITEKYCKKICISI